MVASHIGSGAAVGVGTVVAGKFRLERALSRGGMGSVWVARHVNLGHAVAVKFMDAAFAASPAFRARFEREARAAANLQTPHVVQVQDYGIENGAPYLVMELLQGEDLQRRLDRVRRVSLQEVMRILVQAGKALRRAHDTGLVHRDLKPGNLFLARVEDDEVVKVLDFGIAKETGSKVSGSMTQTGEVLGSPYYMSPEQVRGDKELDARSDLWSLGVILFRAVTGQLPFPGDQLGTVMAKILVDPIPSVRQAAPDLPPAMDRFFAKAFARDRSERFQSVGEMLDALGQIAGTGRAAMGSVAEFNPVSLAAEGGMGAAVAVTTPLPTPGAATMPLPSGGTQPYTPSQPAVRGSTSDRHAPQGAAMRGSTSDRHAPQGAAVRGSTSDRHAAQSAAMVPGGAGQGSISDRYAAPQRPGSAPDAYVASPAPAAAVQGSTSDRHAPPPRSGSISDAYAASPAPGAAVQGSTSDRYAAQAAAVVPGGAGQGSTSDAYRYAAAGSTGPLGTLTSAASVSATGPVQAGKSAAPFVIAGAVAVVFLIGVGVLAFFSMKGSSTTESTAANLEPTATAEAMQAEQSAPTEPMVAPATAEPTPSEPTAAAAPAMTAEATATVGAVAPQPTATAVAAAPTTKPTAAPPGTAKPPTKPGPKPTTNEWGL